MKAGLDGRTPMTPPFVGHFDACLGCMACVTSCPSGVQYAPLIEATRGQIERRHERALGDRLFRRAIFALFPHPARLRFALAPLALLQFVLRPFAAAPLKAAPYDQRRTPYDQRRTPYDERRAPDDERRAPNDELRTTNHESQTTNHDHRPPARDDDARADGHVAIARPRRSPNERRQSAHAA